MATPDDVYQYHHYYLPETLSCVVCACISEAQNILHKHTSSVPEMGTGRNMYDFKQRKPASVYRNRHAHDLRARTLLWTVGVGWSRKSVCKVARRVTGLPVRRGTAAVRRWGQISGIKQCLLRYVARRIYGRIRGQRTRAGKASPAAQFEREEIHR